MSLPWRHVEGRRRVVVSKLGAATTNAIARVERILR
jgi:hypothetical protein